MMAGKVTALFLAILVANPFCCCLAADTEAAVAEHACCPVAMAALAALPALPAVADAEEPAAPAENDPCDCADERRDEWLMAAVEKPMAPQWVLLAEVGWETLSGIEAPSSGYLHEASDLPDAVKPPGRVFSQVHCRYLL